jgi:hypothetical protein
MRERKKNNRRRRIKRETAERERDEFAVVRLHYIHQTCSNRQKKEEKKKNNNKKQQQAKGEIIIIISCRLTLIKTARSPSVGLIRIRYL